MTYATIGEDTSEAGIVAFGLRSLQATYAAVAIREGQRWQRIAAIGCWSKYEMRSGQDVQDEFVSLRLAAEPARETGQHYELIVRTSCEGTGIYTQLEEHYRIIHNELRNVWQFVSRHYRSDPTGPEPSTTLGVYRA